SRPFTWWFVGGRRTLLLAIEISVGLRRSVGSRRGVGGLRSTRTLCPSLPRSPLVVAFRSRAQHNVRRDRHWRPLRLGPARRARGGHVATGRRRLRQVLDRVIPSDLSRSAAATGRLVGRQRTTVRPAAIRALDAPIARGGPSQAACDETTRLARILE